MAACNSFLAPYCSNCSRNGFSSSFARLSSETTLFSGTGASFLFGDPRVRPPCFFFSLKGCAFLYLLIHKIRLYLKVHNIVPEGAHGFAVGRYSMIREVSAY